MDGNERMGRIEEALKHILANQEDLRKDIQEVRTDIRMNYVQKTEFRPVMLIAYGFVAIIAGAVVAAIISGAMKV